MTLLPRPASVLVLVGLSSSLAASFSAGGAQDSRPTSRPAAGETSDQKTVDERWTQEELEEISERIRGDIESLRGQEFLRPVKVQFADKETFLKYAIEETEKHITQERQESSEIMVKMLGLIPSDMDLMDTTLEILEGQVGGFYAPSSDTFWLMENFTGPVAEIILSHELTHALDDQHFDFDEVLNGLTQNTDATYAFQAVVEGSGTGLMTQWAARNMMQGAINLQDMQEAGQLGDMEILKTAPSLIWLPLLSVYMQGASFLSRTDDLVMGASIPHALDDIEQAFREPPLSYEQILHPGKYWDSDLRDDPRIIEYDTSALPEEWEVLLQDTFGELMMAILSTAPAERIGIDLMSNPMAVLNLDFTNEIATGWGGDRAVLLADGEARVLRIETLWDTERDASEFYGAMLVMQDDFERAVEELAAGLGRSRRRYHGAKVQMGSTGDSVNLTLQVGVRKTQLRKLLEALGSMEVAGTSR